MTKRSSPTRDISAVSSRRAVLKALGLASALCPFGGMAVAEGTATPPAGRHVTDAPVANAASPHDRVPFHGAHQAGITTPRPANGMIASFDVVADTPDALERLFRRLTQRISFLTAGGTIDETDPRLPPPDSGIVGPVVRPDGLTVTVSLGASLFEDRPWLVRLKPRRLIRMTRFPNDALDRQNCHGDLALQICANTQDTTIHALRDIIKNCPDQLILKWKQEGNVPVIVPGPDGTVQSARNFLGFRDGSANPDAADAALMDRLVWVGEDRDEPAWAVGGSYQAVRIIRNFVERWDRTPLREQELIMGRVKNSGAPLHRRGGHEFMVPDFSDDPKGVTTPVDAHIRLANPRTDDTRDSLILRRPFNYSNGVTRSGQLDQGLLFICYQADLERGFIAVQRRLDGEPLEEYIKPVGGGYFYVLPGVHSDADHLGSALIAAARTGLAESVNREKRTR
ncbi:iron uptake transporter deferrochelatase/peroxidase subunit [Xanthobacteraceae bacterium Astr-EGSB]|uniref:iron uptake transporter deferrochelatase/peroxidase subunit n=1 Tax=Astrobacterium formosum TaxID=3069710 RepID=UPI0027AFEBEB|nr:iron uptake transporter deferrochelatase/peroxidase subunit [Xanthobacteraceae bacterium Astr-EGSB]